MLLFHPSYSSTMSPTKLHAKQDHDHDQKPLKINKHSTFIHHLPPPPSTGSSTTTTFGGVTIKTQPPPPPPPPVIIYTHSPKVIHTHPRDFMALVQKLTGYTPPPGETQPMEDHRRRRDQWKVDENESSSVVTEEHGSSVNDVPRVNSCFVDGGVGVVAPPPPYKVVGFDRCFHNTPVYPVNPTNFLCTQTHQLPFYAPDSLLLNRNSSSSSLHALREYPGI